MLVVLFLVGVLLDSINIYQSEEEVNNLIVKRMSGNYFVVSLLIMEKVVG